MIRSSAATAVRSASRRVLSRPSPSGVSVRRTHTAHSTNKSRLPVRQQQQHKSTLALQPPAIHKLANPSSQKQTQQLSRDQIKSLFLSASIPMIGFGFMDNFIMITAGSAIDHSLGVHMGLATMTAAAIGQVVSDVSGVIFGDTLSRVFSISPAKLTEAQKKLALVGRIRLAGAVLGVICGCTLGATALCLIPDGREESQNNDVVVAGAATLAGNQAMNSSSPIIEQQRIREQLERLQNVMKDVMTSPDDKWLDRGASCTLFVNEGLSNCLPATRKVAPRSFFGSYDPTPVKATVEAMSSTIDDPAVGHTLKEGRVVVFADTIYVPVMEDDDNNKTLGIVRIKLDNGSFYTGSEIKDAKRVARNLGFFLKHLV